jgi:hypothetical protein
MLARLSPSLLERSSSVANWEYNAARLNRTEDLSYTRFSRVIGKEFGEKGGAYEIWSPIYVVGQLVITNERLQGIFELTSGGSFVRIDTSCV